MDEFEHEIRMIPMQPPEAFQKTVQDLAAEGWQLVPGFPVAIYHIVRVKKQDTAGALEIRLGTDDSLIGILKPDGYVHYADGRKEKAQ